MAKDKIHITGLQLSSSVGVYDTEKAHPQPLSLDVTICIDLEKAAKTDSLESTFNYAALSKKLREFASKKHHNLLESRLTELLSIILEDLRVDSVYGRLYKPLAVPGALVSVERTLIRS